MKALSVLLGLVLLSNVSSADTASLPQAQLITPSEVTEPGTVQEFADASACEASLQCYNGRIIGCTASGYRTSCQRSSHQVLCQAWGNDGSYSRAYDVCR